MVMAGHLFILPAIMVTMILSQFFLPVLTLMSLRGTTLDSLHFFLPAIRKVEVVKVLLKDSRVDINLADNGGWTPLWRASKQGDIEAIKWMIASGKEIKSLDVKATNSGPFGDDQEYTAIEIARKKNKTEVVSLLERFMANSMQTRHEVRVELADKDAAELFAKIVFLCDDFLRLKEPATSSSSINTVASVRFFTISMHLPMELQMVLCNRVFGSAKENILSKDSELAFKHIARTFNIL
jgi:hypothetical protein